MTRPTQARSSGLSEIAYHDYLLLLVQMDSEWSRRCRREDDYPPPDNHVQFRDNCIFFGEGINANYSEWHRANEDGADPKKGFLDRYLYNPISYLPFGHADDACVVLLDDQSPAHRLTMRMNRRIEDVSLAYCLRMRELVATVLNQDEDPERRRRLETLADTVFCEPHKLFDTHLGPRPVTSREEVGKLLGQTKWVEHEIQSDCPFLVFTRFRMDGIASVTHFLLAQQAIYKAMVTSVLTTIDRLETLAQDCSDDYLKLQDIANTRCCLIDLKEAEEIGTAVFCSNFTVAMSIVAELRKLTYHDAFCHEALLRRRLEEDETLQLVVRKAIDRPDAEPQACVKQIELNHLFRWTTSSILVSPRMIRDGSHDQECSGKASGEIRVQVAAGHRERARDGVISQVGGLEQKLDGDWDSFPVGEDDLVVPIVGDTATAPDANRRWVPIGDVLKCWRECTARSIAECQSDDRFTGRHFVEMRVDVEVPVPQLPPEVKRENGPPKGFESEPEHYAVLVDVLIRVQEKLCPPLHPDAAATAESVDKLPLNTPDLYHWQRRVGLPVKLRQTIESLYQMFFAVLADSYRFDLVLDLYDVLASLHRLITHTLADEIRLKDNTGIGGESCQASSLPILDVHCVRQIELLVSAIENALQHRIAKVFPVGNPLDMAIDFRGGLNQMILAAGAPMLCSVGLFRRCIVEPELEQLLDYGTDSKWLPRPRTTVGVVSRISLLSGMACQPLQMELLTGPYPRLAHYEVDVPHVLDIPSYADYFHEAGHLVFDSLFREKVPIGFRGTPVEPRWADLGPLWKMRVSQREDDRDEFCAKRLLLGEIFALLFGHVFVFGSDRDTALRYHAMAFCRSLDSVGWDPGYEATGSLADGGNGSTAWRESVIQADTIDRFIDVAIRLAVVQMLLPEATITTVDRGWFDNAPPLPTAEDAAEDFFNILQEVKRYHASFETTWRDTALGDEFEDIAVKKFRVVYNGLQQYLRWVFETVAEIYRRDFDRSNLPAGDNGWQEIEDAIMRGFQEGRPLLRCLLPSGEPRKGSPNVESWREPRDTAVDARVLIGRILCHYLRQLPRSKDERVVLHRNSPEGSVAYPSIRDDKDQRKWSEFQIDPGSAPLFCPVPERRRDRTREQIVIRKTLRGIAATFHGRRLFRLVYDTLSD